MPWWEPVMDAMRGGGIQQRYREAVGPAQSSPPRHPLAPVRAPFPGESDFFKNNPGVSGMAASDDRVTLNPHSNLTPEQRASVMRNEQARIFMRNQMRPSFGVTPEQSVAFGSYSPDPQDVRETIAARLFAGDPSAGAPTGAQSGFVDALRGAMPGQRPGMAVPPRSQPTPAWLRALMATMPRGR